MANATDPGINRRRFSKNAAAGAAVLVTSRATQANPPASVRVASFSRAIYQDFQTPKQRFPRSSKPSRSNWTQAAKTRCRCAARSSRSLGSACSKRTAKRPPTPGTPARSAPPGFALNFGRKSKMRTGRCSPKVIGSAAGPAGFGISTIATSAAPAATASDTMLLRKGEPALLDVHTQPR